MVNSSAYVLTTLARNWWTFVLRGAIAIAFGLIAWAWPGLALYTLIVLFAIYTISGGALSVIAAIRRISERERWIPLAIDGAIGIGAGLVALIWPDLAAKTFLYIIAIWAILSGALEIAAAIRLSKEIRNEWLLALTGFAGILFGVIAIARPKTGALAVLWLIGISSIVVGALLIALGWRLRGLHLAIEARGSGGSAHQVRSRSQSTGTSAKVTSFSDTKAARRSEQTAIAEADVSSAQAAAIPSDPPVPDPASGAAARLTRRERALQELIQSLPPEGEGWMRGDGTTDAPADYPLKGNINSRIYHRPGGQSYHETIAEVYFATDDSAVSAGFRPRREPDGVTPPPATAAASTEALAPAEGDSMDDVTDVLEAEAAERDITEVPLDPVGIDFDGELETLDDIAPDDSEVIGAEFRETELALADEAAEIEVTDGAAASWEPIDDELATDLSDTSGEPEAEAAGGAGVDQEQLNDESVTEASATSEAPRSGDEEVGETVSAGVTDAIEDADLGITTFEPVADAEADEFSEAMSAAHQAAIDEGVTPAAVSDFSDEADAAVEDEPEPVEGDAETREAAEPATAASASKPKEERELDELIATLPPELDGWVRGLGGHQTPTGYPVKGNASSRLYHMPGGRNYAATIPEICFATPDDARAGGFRPRSGDPTELDPTLLDEVDLPASYGIRSAGSGAAEEEDPHAALIDSLPPEGEGWVRGNENQDCPDGYSIKGNASSRIYHVPGGGSYEVTIPEFCFATPDDAESAGFRAARN